MITRIIAAFPGCGKSFYHRNNPDTSLDSDSSQFSWEIRRDGTKVRNHAFPENYIRHIKDNIGKYEFIFVSTHKEVLDALRENCLFFYLIYPNRFNPAEKTRFINHYKERGNDEAFIELISSNWDNWLSAFDHPTPGCIKTALPAYWFVTDVIRNILEAEK